MSATRPEHAYALLTPWYEIERQFATTPGVLVSRPHRPLIQRYDSDDFIAQVLADPSRSVAFDSVEDCWTCPVPSPKIEKDKVGGGIKVTAHRLLPTDLRKLYQPNHQRFYVVAVELFCDEPGFPRPSSTEGLEVFFVLRKVVVSTGITPPAVIRKFARDHARARLSGKAASKPRFVVSGLGREAATLVDEDAADIARAQYASGKPSMTIEVSRHGEAWTKPPAGAAGWVATDGSAGALDHAGRREQTYPMWRRPPKTGDCHGAETRSLWFGVIPTFSGEIDECGSPKLDDRSIYELRCGVRVKRPDGHEECPEILYWSASSEPFKLAAFFDPAGTKNRRVHLRMPDLRRLAAAAGTTARPLTGGMTVEHPPGSLLQSEPAGAFPKKKGTPKPTAENCSFAIELFAIVAMFLFLLFLPIVIFVFQLWWMLLLRFCWPSNDQALAELAAHFAGLGGAGTEPIPSATPEEAAAFNAAHEAAKAAKAAGRQPQPGSPVPGSLQAPVADPLCDVETP